MSSRKRKRATPAEVVDVDPQRLVAATLAAATAEGLTLVPSNTNKTGWKSVFPTAVNVTFHSNSRDIDEVMRLRYAWRRSRARSSYA